jgi:glycosyltransferase involved in cell wall biosynthesis
LNAGPSPRRRVLVISYNHPPSPGIAGTRWFAMARYLRELGHSVTTVASDAWGVLPDDAQADVIRVGDLRSRRAVRWFLRRGELRVDGHVGVERPPSALITRVLVPEMNVATWLPAVTAKVRRLVAQRSFDCLVTTSPPESTHLLGLLLGARRPAWIADFRDGWTFEPYRERFPTAAQSALDGWLERRVCGRADVVVAATRPIVDDISERLCVAAEWVSNGWVSPTSASSAYSSKAKSADLSLVYTGTLSGEWGRDPEPLLRALKIVRETSDSPSLKLIHAGGLRTYERTLIDDIGIADAVEHLGTLSREDTLALQRSADALVLVTSRHTSEATGKLFEYLVSGRPILALAEGNEAARIVQETNTGVTVPPDDVDAIVVALRAVASGKLARQYAPRNLEQYTYPGPAERMAEVIEEAVRRHAARR